MPRPLMEETVPPQRRAADDDRSLGELARGQDAILQRLDTLNSKIEGLSTTYTPREVHDLAVGGMKVDLRRHDEELAKVEKRVEDAERETNRRFRQAVTLTLTAVAAPLTVGLILYLLSQVAGR